jgi:hypothetical protein
MAYANFTLSELKSRFGLTAVESPLFRHVAPLDPGELLPRILDRAGGLGRFSEKARSERLIAPVLDRVADFMGGRYSCYSGAELNVDPAAGLNGECDFLLSREYPVPSLQAPVMVVVEAKLGNITGAYPQCVAQMIGARLYNEKAGRPTPRLHGCVTTGDDWFFCRLDGSALTTDADVYALANVGKILGILVECMKGSDPQ